MDSETPSVFENKQVKARKKHKCCECYSIIAPGDDYYRAKGCWDGEWLTYKTCAACDQLRHDLNDQYYGMPPFEGLREWVVEAGLEMPTAC